MDLWPDMIKSSMVHCCFLYILLWMISTLAPMKNLTFFPISYYLVEFPYFGLPSLTFHLIWVIIFPCGKVTS